MKVLARNIRRMNGIGKDSGNAYDFTQITIEVPTESFSNDKTTVQSFGVDTAVIDCSPTFIADNLHKIRAIANQFPLHLELEMTESIRMGRLQSVCKSFEVVNDFKESTKAEYEAIKAKS